MKLGEIKLEALRLMNESGYKDLDISSYDIYSKEPRFQKYLFRMGGSINRAIDFINYNKIIKPVKIALKDLVESVGTSSVTYNIGNRSNIYEILYVYYLGSDGVVYPDFYTVADTITVFDTNTDVMLVYIPKISPVDIYAEPDTEVDIPDNIARIIPYYIKYELYQEEEPTLSVMAKEQFENMVKNMKNNYSFERQYDIVKEYAN